MTDHSSTNESNRSTTEPTSSTDPTRSTDDRPSVAFVCVQNAGRSQIALAFAERERDERGIDVDLVSGGTYPADAVHDVVIEVMAEAGFDLADRTPREILPEELLTCDYVATMGCSTLDLGEAGSTIDVRDWDLSDPHGAPLDEARAIRDEVRARVRTLFDELEG